MESTCYEGKSGCTVRGEHYHDEYVRPSMESDRLTDLAERYGETPTSLRD